MARVPLITSKDQSPRTIIVDPSSAAAARCMAVQRVSAQSGDRRQGGASRRLRTL